MSIGTGSSVTLDNSVVTNSSASLYGGAILIGGGELLTLNGATFTHCSANLYGGIVYGQDGGRATFANTHFSGNSAQQAGGVIALNFVDATFSDCTILRSAAQQFGGVLWVPRGIELRDTTVCARTRRCCVKVELDLPRVIGGLKKGRCNSSAHRLLNQAPVGFQATAVCW